MNVPHPLEPAPAPEVFVSYSHRDAERVDRVVGCLEQAGVMVWKDGEQIRGGEYYGERIAGAIRASKVVLVMCSPNSLHSDEVHSEVALTWGNSHKNFLPLWLVKPFPYPDRFAYCLAKYQWLEVADRPSENWMPLLLSALAGFGVHVPGHGNAPVQRPAADLAPPPLPRPDLPLIDSRDLARREQARWAGELKCDVSWVNSLGMRFQLIPPGRFFLGAAADDRAAQANERPRRETTVPRPFWVAAFPVTNAVLRAFLESAPEAADTKAIPLARDLSFAALCRGGEAADDLPAVEVSASDAEAICAWLCRGDGRPYRLPTEAEWEYLARAGATGAFWWEAHVLPEERAVFGGAAPEPIDTRRANAWGLVDVLGNVTEWTASAYAPLESGRASRAAGLIGGGTRTVRGGCHRDRLQDLRVSRRLSMFQGTRRDDLGFRVVFGAG